VRQASVPILIQTLNLEIKLAILRKRAEQKKVTLPKDVALYIAQNVRTTSALTGALARLVAHSSLTGREITYTYTRQVLKDFLLASNVTVDPFQTMPAGQRGTNEEQKRRLHAIGTDCSFVLGMLKAWSGGKTSHVRRESGVNILEVNMRECERNLLTRRDAYERWVERRARKRKQA
jgi:hypothetical protein